MARRVFWLFAIMLIGAGCGDSASTPAEKALRELRAGRYEQAIAICDETLRLNPQDAEAYHSRGLAYHYRNGPGDLPHAIVDLSEAIALAPKKPEPYYSRSVAYRDQGELGKAAADEATARDLDLEMKEMYAQLPITAPPSGTTIGEKPAKSASPDNAEAAKGREPTKSSADVLDEYLRKNEAEAAGKLNSGSLNSGSLMPSTDPLRGEPGSKKATRQKPRPLFGQEPRRPTQPAGDDDSMDEDNALDALAPLNKGSSRLKDSADDRTSRPATRSRGGAAGPSVDPLMPLPAGSPRGTARSEGVQRYQRPIQQPFPQPTPRPTGFVPQPLQPDTFVPARRPSFSPPGSELPGLTGPGVDPAVRPPTAEHFDYNP
jgi:hypothetical protein